MNNNKLPKALQNARKDTSWLENIEKEKAHEEWLDLSFEIALKAHARLKEAGMTQKQLAQGMGVSAQYVGKLLKGKENLTLQQITKLQAALGLQLIAVPAKVTVTFSTDWISEKLAGKPSYLEGEQAYVQTAGESNYAICA